ncbi:MAG: DNA-binding protein [Verrucomicrobia bacterium]|nr:DNA-binding protein [Verrucomicrobiota bacterium]
MDEKIARVLRTGLDERISVLRGTEKAARKPSRGWLRAVRQATGLSQLSIASKLGITRQAYAEIERAEERGSISLRTLERSAAAIGCELGYFLVPRESVARTFDELSKVQHPHFKHLQASEHSMMLENQSVGDLRARSRKLE